MVEVVPDYRFNLGKFNLGDFKEVEAGRVLQLVHHVGKEVGKEIAVTVELQKFAVVLRWYGLEFPISSTPFTALIVFSPYPVQEEYPSSVRQWWTGWLCLHP